MQEGVHPRFNMEFIASSKLSLASFCKKFEENSLYDPELFKLLNSYVDYEKTLAELTDIFISEDIDIDEESSLSLNFHYCSWNRRTVSMSWRGWLVVRPVLPTRFTGYPIYKPVDEDDDELPPPRIALKKSSFLGNQFLNRDPDGNLYWGATEENCPSIMDRDIEAELRKSKILDF